MDTDYLSYAAVIAIILISLLLPGCYWDVVVIPPPPVSPGYHYYWHPDYPHGHYPRGGPYHYHRR